MLVYSLGHHNSIAQRNNILLALRALSRDIDNILVMAVVPTIYLALSVVGLGVSHFRRFRRVELSLAVQTDPKLLRRRNAADNESNPHFSAAVRR